MDLFVNKPVSVFEKSAATSKAAAAFLDEDPSTWPRQILIELFRSAPETSEYNPQVSMMQVDSEQGFGLGCVSISNTTDSALAATRVGPDAKKVLIPVIIKSHVLQPLDLIMMGNGKMLPLNTRTLREALFRPETFEMTTEDWGDTSLWNQFYPPGRSDNQFGGGVSQSMGGGAQGGMSTIIGSGMKMSSFQAVLPSDLAETIKEASGLRGSEAFHSAIQSMQAVEGDRPVDILKTAAAVLQRPDVVQIGYDDLVNQYWVKQASRSLFAPSERTYFSREAVLKLAGQDVINDVDLKGTTTMSASLGADEHKAEAMSVITQPGTYTVKSVDGKTLTGWVIPNLMDVDGDVLPMAVFTNGSAAMVQSSIVGRRTGGAINLPSAPPRGTGIFYFAGEGGVVGTAPLKVKGSEEGMGGGSCWIVETLTGESGTVRVAPGLSKMISLGGELHIPSGAKFLPLMDETLVALVGDEDKAKTAGIRQSISIGPSTLSFQGLPKLASFYSGELSPDDTVFTLCLAGMDPSKAVQKVAESQSREVLITGVSDVKTAAEFLEGKKKEASVHSEEVRSLRQILVKEAATLPDAMSVDAVLSLGFINSENVRMYVNHIPYLEKCLSKVCELVLGSRIGLVEIPEFAAARAARGLDEVIQGLRSLSLRDVREGNN